jgi:transposase
MLIQLSHKIELDPNNIQQGYFRKACGIARFTYNWALEEWNRQFQEGLKPSALALKKKFNTIKNEQFPWISEVLRDANSQPFSNLGRAFVNFFNGTGKYPAFKKRGVNDSFYIANDKFRLEGKKIRIPKLGWVRMREHLRFSGKILSATISRMAAVEIVRADCFYPSSKTCCKCEYKKDNLSLSERVFRCEHCGLEIDRDVNAAINLEKWAAGSAVTACGEAVRPKQLVRASSMKQEFLIIPANG